MDHLPLPRNPAIGTFEIQFLATRPYDGGAFYGYPERRGWKVEEQGLSGRKFQFLRGEEEVTDETVIGELVQTWLYFGLLSRCLGVQAQLDEFSRMTSDGDRVLCSASLEHLVSVWSSEVSLLQKDELSANLKEVHGYLEHASVVIDGHLTTGQIRDNETLCRIYMGIVALGEYISQSLSDVADHNGIDFVGQICWGNENSDLGYPLLKVMRENGWCPSRLKYLDLAEFRWLSMLWYNANLVPPATNDGHEHCSSVQCVSFQVDNQDYRTLHSVLDCGCDFIGPDATELAKIVAGGSTPLVRLKRNNTPDSIEVELTELRPGQPFIAISHVWADGRGNKQSNSLPICMADNIQRVVDEAAEYIHDSHLQEMPFWMDTLCLPVRPRDLRNQAIANMSVPFRSVDAVVVLDNYLLDVSADDSEALELFARVSASKWTTRLWTFSEGRLAKRVLFRFQDYSLDLQVVVTEYWNRDCVPSKADHALWVATISAYTANWIVPVDYVQRGLGGIRAALSSRTTSWKSDEALCLASILDLDLRSIAQAEDSSKMEVFWGLMPFVPTGFLFAQTTQRLTKKGVRWAPSTLLSHSDLSGSALGIGVNLPENSQPTGEGLLARLPSIFVVGNDSSDVSLLIKHRLMAHCLEKQDVAGSIFHFKDLAGLWYECVVSKPWHHQMVVPDPVTHDIAFVLSHQCPTSTVSPETLLLSGSRAVPALLVMYPSNNDPEREEPQYTRATAIMHIGICIQNQITQIFRTEIEKCERKIYSMHKHRIDRLLLCDDREGLVDTFVDLLQDYSGFDELAEASLDYDEYTGPDYPDDEEMILFVAGCLQQLCYYRDWHHIEVGDQLVSWCID